MALALALVRAAAAQRAAAVAAVAARRAANLAGDRPLSRPDVGPAPLIRQAPHR